MEINKKIRSKTKEVDDYICALEDWIENFEASNIKKLIMACNEVAGTVADDIILLKDNGNDEEIDNKLQMMGSKKSKIYAKYLDVVASIKHFKTLQDYVNELKPKTSTKEDKSSEEPTIELGEVIKPRNISDLALAKKKN